MSISFNSTAILAQQQKKQILQQVASVADTGCFLEGKQNKILVKKLQYFLKAPHVVLVASGHDALTLALNSLHLQPTDEVVLPANAYPTAFAVYQQRSSVVLADVDGNGQITLSEIQKRITPNTKAVIVVHLYGLAGEISQIAQYLKQQKIILIEDCAQAFGTTVDGQAAGTFGQFGCFSFYPTKNLGALGDGGAIVVQRAADYAYLLKAKTYGERERYHSQFLAGHSRLPEIQAAVLNLYLQQFRQWQRQKKSIAKYFSQQLYAHHLDLFVRTLSSGADVKPSLHLFVLRAKWRDQLQTFLSRQQIETHIHYPVPIHQIKAFQPYLSGTANFPYAEKLSQEIISLPFHQFLKKSEVDELVKTMEKFYLTQIKQLESITFLFPVYNDARSISELVAKADRLGSYIAKKFQIIVVNDGSQDNSKVVLQRLQKKYQHLRVIHHQHNQGYGGALMSGFAATQTEWLFYTDGDGQYDPNELILLLHQLHRHPRSAVINGYKKNRCDDLLRQKLGKLYNFSLHGLYHLPIRDLDCDFRLIKVSKLKELHLSAKSGMICLELISQLSRNGATFQEAEVHHYARRFGQSQFFHLKHLAQMLREHLAYFFRFYFGERTDKTTAMLKPRSSHA